MIRAQQGSPMEFTEYGETIPLHNDGQQSKRFTYQTTDYKKCKKDGGWVNDDKI